jgi:hypothetical protein
MNEFKRWWVSWYQPTEDYRPLHDPPCEAVRGWWCSGETETGSFTLCAVVDAPDEQGVKDAVYEDWPEAVVYRFITEKPNDFTPGDRFPLSDWMIPRIAALGPVTR